MSFDTATRNRLASFVAKCRQLLCGDYHSPGGDMAARLAHYGIQVSGNVAPIESLTHLDEPGLETARLLRDLLAHKRARSPEAKVWKAFDGAVYDLLQEQGFTALNRLCALRMAEERKLITQCVGKGQQSEGFELFEYHTGKTNESCPVEMRYQQFLYAFFDELALDLGALFSRHSPQGLLFPSPQALQTLLGELNHPELAALWAQDETIGWIYQYWNSKEERGAMREASAAPRNSRELAVRNQFFTPRYVVEFLTDNTLGRIWYEMTQGKTGLKEQCRYLVRRPSEVFLQAGETAPQQEVQDGLSQEELLRQTVYVPHRELKDPREIRLLDPACGSMHFGLYAFDLFEVIYTEWWDNFATPAQREELLSACQLAEGITAQPISEPTEQRTYFQRHIPRLILENNIHGIDIDPRATQIAGLSLYLRAQRAWLTQKLNAPQRPQIRRANIVCAEPMPGEKELLQDFVNRAFPLEERPIFLRMLEDIFDKMQLAGEAGSLLKIEEEIRSSVAEAKKRWKEGPKLEQSLLFSESAPGAKQKDLKLDLSGITDEQFWGRVEERIYTALSEYAGKAESGGYERRLFAEDAARGFAFIDACRKRYDVTVMNPPFGEPAEKTRHAFKSAYPCAADNVAICFLLRGEELLHPGGITSSITDCSWAKKYDYKDFRAHILTHRNLRALAHLGWGILDNANVETNICVRGASGDIAFTANLSVVEAKAATLQRLIVEPSISNICSYLRFDKLPNDVFAFEMGEAEYGPYEAEMFLSRSFMVGVAGIKSCNSTADFRCWWEVRISDFSRDGNWRLLQNGSPYCPLHYPVPFAVKCDQGKWTQVMANGGARPGEAYYDSPGLAYGKRTDNMYAYVKPAGEVFSQEGQAIFPLNAVTIWGALALANSSVYNAHVNYVAGQHKYHNYINKVCLDTQRLPLTSDAAREANGILRRLDVVNEITHSFCGPHLCSEFNWNLSAAERAAASKERLSSVFELRSRINAEISSALEVVNPSEIPATVDYYQHYFSSSFEPTLVPRIWLSYAIGIAFGRWDIRYASGERHAPELPDPFAPLPVCPPGMLQGADGLPLSYEAGRRERVEGHYPLDVAWDGILVDDPNHPLDIERRVREVFEILWRERAGAIVQEAAEILEEGLRDYFRKPGGFFADHLKRYSKSRRKAPIYWPLSTPSGNYTLWLYYHRLNDGTLYKVVEQFVEPKQAEVQATYQTLAVKESRTKAEDKELEDAETLIGELAAFRDDLLRLAKIWKPNLNDGVVITAAPLWKHFRLQAWQKELRSTWESLERGEYDWSHLAYSIWPERVIEKCKSDPSIAVAHGMKLLCTDGTSKPKKKRSTRKTGFSEESVELNLNEQS